MPRKSPPPPKKASGANIENWQRHTSQVLLRLSPLAARALREGAEREETTMSGYVERLVLEAIPAAD